jgi:hypothetical protein
MDKFLNAFDQPKLNHEFEVIIINLSTKKNPGSYGYITEFYHTFKEQLLPYSNILMKWTLIL